MFGDIKLVLQRCDTLVADFAGAGALVALLLAGLYAPLILAP